LGIFAAKPTNTRTTKHIDNGSGRGGKIRESFPGTEIGVAELRSRRFLDGLNGTGVNLILKLTTTIENHQKLLHPPPHHHHHHPTYKKSLGLLEGLRFSS